MTGDLERNATRAGTLRTYREGDVAILVLDRPDAYNALGTPELELLGRALSDCTNVGGIVLAAEGRHFCVGADLTEVASAWGNRVLMRAYLSLFHDVADAIAASPVPVIAAVQGLVLAGGLELALACDLILATDDAEFGDQHINVDLIPGGGGSQRLPRVIGARRALALQMFGTRVDARTAFNWGLVHSVHPGKDLRAEAVRAVAQIASRDRLAISRMRQLALAASTLPLREALALELEIAIDHMSTSQLPEALGRFVQSRSARTGGQRSRRPEEVI